MTPPEAKREGHRLHASILRRLARAERAVGPSDATPAEDIEVRVEDVEQRLDVVESVIDQYRRADEVRQ